MFSMLTIAFALPMALSGAGGSAPAEDYTDEFDFAEPRQPNYADYYCPDEGEEEEEEEEEEFPDSFCLARCEGWDDFRPTHKNSIDKSDKDFDWCEKRAKRYCHKKYDKDLDEWCWGEEDE